MELLKNQFKVNELFNDSTFDVLNSVKTLKYLEHIKKVECSVLKNKSIEIIEGNLKLKEKKLLEEEIDNYRKEFYQTLEEKLENKLLGCCLYMADPELDGWIESLQKFDMEMNFSSSIIAKNKAIKKIIEICEDMIKKNPEYGLNKASVMNEVLSTTKNKEVFEEILKSNDKNKVKFNYG